MYKPMIRIFKNARTYMDERGIFDKSLAPWYFTEGLLYNVPNTCFRSTYNQTMFEMLSWLHQADFSKFVCQNEQTYLFGSTPEQWNMAKATTYLRAMIDLWNEWGKWTMHAYSTDSNERITIPLYLAVASILSAWLLPKVLEQMGLSVAWWFDAPAVMGFYGLYYRLFDNILWKCKWLIKIGIIKTPNLNGTWDGFFLSSYDDHNTQNPAQIEIKQTWTKMCVVFKNGTSRSSSITSSLTTSQAEGVVLSYEYQNAPNYDTVSTMQIHRGFTRLILSNDKKQLEGDYYTGRGRLSYGMMNFKKPWNDIKVFLRGFGFKKSFIFIGHGIARPDGNRRPPFNPKFRRGDGAPFGGCRQPGSLAGRRACR